MKSKRHFGIGQLVRLKSYVEGGHDIWLEDLHDPRLAYPVGYGSLALIVGIIKHPDRKDGKDRPIIMIDGKIGWVYGDEVTTLDDPCVQPDKGVE
jgi:hypothetical protein